MVSAVLLLWSMIVVSGALFVVSDCGFWCGFFFKTCGLCGAYFVVSGCGFWQAARRIGAPRKAPANQQISCGLAGSAWCLFCALRLWLVVLFLWSLIVVSHAFFVLFGCAFWSCFSFASTIQQALNSARFCAMSLGFRV